jgi:hypothetical protein
MSNILSRLPHKTYFATKYVSFLPALAVKRSIALGGKIDDGLHPWSPVTAIKSRIIEF